MHSATINLSEGWLSRLLASAALVGLLASVAWHVGILVGHDFLGQAGIVLFAGVFVVWFPTIIRLKKFAPTLQRHGGWKLLLEGAPNWVVLVVGGTLACAIVNSFIGFTGTFSTNGSGFWRIGSGHAMAFYAVAWGLSLAAARREKLRIEWKCQNGHDMYPSAQFCSECGMPTRRMPTS